MNRGAAGEGVSQQSPTYEDNVDARVRTLDGFDVVVRSGHRHEALALIGSHQHGRVARRQLLHCGWTKGMIEAAVGRRRLHPRRRGVYAVGHLASTKLSGRAEALLDVGDDAMLVGRSVLAHHGLLVDDEEVHVGVSSTRRPRRRSGIHMHYFGGLASEITDGLPMTSVARALLDVAHELPADDLGALVDEAVAGVRVTTRAEILRILRENPGHPGCQTLRSTMDARRPSSRTESPAARQLLTLIRMAGLPLPETEVWLHGFRVDNLWRRIGLVVEVNSHTYHGIIRANYKRDQRKTRTLQAHGLEVMGIDADEIRDEPFKVVAELAAAINRLSAHAA